MSMFDQTWLASRITAVQTEIEEVESAFAALAAGAIETYTLDTGQSRQVVTRSSIATMQRTLDRLYNTLATLEARRSGLGVVTARPAW